MLFRSAITSESTSPTTASHPPRERQGPKRQEEAGGSTIKGHRELRSSSERAHAHRDAPHETSHHQGLARHADEDGAERRSAGSHQPPPLQSDQDPRVGRRMGFRGGRHLACPSSERVPGTTQSEEYQRDHRPPPHCDRQRPLQAPQQQVPHRWGLQRATVIHLAEASPQRL